MPRAKKGAANGSDAAAAAMDSTETVVAPKRRGRPPGSKNKVKTASAGKRRGRPPGSKNVAKKAAEATEATTATATTKGRRGRPKGSKNRATKASTPARAGRPRGTAAATAQTGAGIGAQIDMLIHQLQSMRSEVDRLEGLARQLTALKSVLG